jgi:4-hydroxy-tetrahydrodipicolinate reductase
MKEIRVTLLGAGRVGRDVTRLLAQRTGFRVVAAHSRNPKYQGKDIGIHGGAAALGATITGDRAQALGEPSDVVVIATTSFLREVAEDICAAASAGHNVICTAEEMLFPWIADKSISDDLNKLAKKNKVSILGVGANPGFIFDSFVLTATGAMWAVDFIRGKRVVDCSHFSSTIKKRLGFGYMKKEFDAGVRAGIIYGHIGFSQSIALIAATLGVKIDAIEKDLEPIIAEKPYVMDTLEIAPGQTVGFLQRVVGMSKGKPWYQAEFVGHATPREAGLEVMDSFDIEGYPELHFAVKPGFNPHFTSAAMVANSLRRVVDAKPGLVTIADLPPAFPSPANVPFASWPGLEFGTLKFNRSRT